MQGSEKENQTRTLSSRILEEFRERIRSGELAEGARLPTELEIARNYQVSRGTIRQVFGALVNEGLLERVRGSGTYVREPASSYQYQQQKSPSPQVLQPAQALQKSIGLILSQGDELNLDILLGVEQAAKPRGYQLSFAYAEEDPAELAADIERLRACTDGLIIFPLSDTAHNASLVQLKEDNYTFVLIDRYIPELDCDYVTSDNVGGGYRATEHLLILGYTRIGFVSWIGPRTTSIRDRLQGYRKALQEYQRPYHENFVYISPPETGSSFYDDIVTSSDRPEAIFAVNDAEALRLLQAAQRHNLRVPEDLALVGFDDVSYASLLSTPLTTVAQQRTEMGMRAGTLLINRIEGLVSGPSKHIELPTNLIIRQSCGARLRVSSFTADARSMS